MVRSAWLVVGGNRWPGSWGRLPGTAGLVVRLVLWGAAEISVGGWCADAEFSVTEAALLAGLLARVNGRAGGVRAARATGKSDEERNQHWGDEVRFHEVAHA